MKWWDYIISAISAVGTIFSLIGAYKSNVYYQNSKQLTIYANTNSAFIESQKIITTLTEMLKLGNRIQSKNLQFLLRPRRQLHKL
ncbi:MULTISPECIES: hypothetical protein [Clostridium]|uniref:Uncharacterized protein n=1 Tax=Clostridium frigoriphilum TaxID=443253 RepID=A0ABU7UVN2_9CLOT|nr:hypothetical protein [Clostridium sp. DSM 17811]MBU3101703.1 hypothetical protein [Clostridium sp. DSM 17811]